MCISFKFVYCIYVRSVAIRFNDDSIHIIICGVFLGPILAHFDRSNSKLVQDSFIQKYNQCDSDKYVVLNSADEDFF